MATPVVIGATEYKLKKDAVAAIRGLISESTIGETITGDRHDFIEALLAKHPHAEDKIGCGVEFFFVRINVVSGRSTRGFWIQRLDGSQIDFSWVECLKPTSHRQRVLNAMRVAVQDDVHEFKMAAFAGDNQPTCWITGSNLSVDQTDVHHDPTFLSLAEQWTNGCYDAIEVDVGSRAAQFGDFLIDETLKTEWVDFHRRCANLHLVRRDAHKTLKRS